MSASFEVEPGRLNGWKEIAFHLGKGTRTVQRWEKLYGLPVHRIGREGGEIVFAFRDEIDRWTASTERERAANGEGASPPDEDLPANGGAPAAEAGGSSEGSAASPRRRAVRWPILAGALALVAVALGVRLLHLDGPWTLPLGKTRDGTAAEAQGRPGRKPAGWRLGDERFTVLDAAGEKIFEYNLGFPVNSASAIGPLARDDRRVLFGDIDADGETEVLLAVPAVARENSRLYCFAADGRLRFVHQPTGRARYGGKDYAEPWLVHHVFLTQGPGGRKSLWAVFIHNLWFPSRLQELDPSGSVKGEYWSDGYVNSVSEDTWRGRPVVLVGSANNEFKGAGLAILDRDRVSGSAPATKPDYICSTCPGAHPREFVVFPSLCLLTRRGGIAALLDAWVEGGERLMVQVVQGFGSADGSESAGAGPVTAYYTLGPDLVPVHAEISAELQAVHASLEKGGLLDHRFGARDDAAMFPVRRWDGTRFVDLPRVKVEH
jgi:hypothetical protein